MKVFKTCVFILAFSFLYTNLLFSTTIQTITDYEKITSTDSDEIHTWYATDKKIDPVKYTKKYLNDIEQINKSSLVWNEAAAPDWHKTPVPENLFSIKYFKDKMDKINEVWYRKTIVLPEKILHSLTFKPGIITDRDVIYFNGHRIGATGKWDSKLPRAYDKQRLYEIPHEYLNPGGANIILIHVQKYYHYEIGVYRNTTEIGPTSKIRHAFYKDNIIQIILLIVYLTVGGYFFFLYFRRLKEHANLFFALFAFSLVIYQFLRTQFKYYFGIDFYTLKTIEYIILMGMVPLIYYFLRSYFEFPKNKLMKYLDIGIFLPNTALAIIVLIILSTNNVKVYNDLNMNIVQPIIWPVYLILTFSFVIYRAIKKDRDAYYILLGLAILVSSAVLDVLSNRGIILLPRTMGYAFLTFVMALALILANKFVRLNEEVEDLNQNLEKKVKDRTEELQKTLNEVRELKNKQDGDYFLTSLLLEPLGQNHAQSSNVKVDFFLKSKKQFQFKKWKKAIGGDINIAHTIELRGKEYTVFINADAMGKSIQGAGGALVLGAVFYSIVERTKFSEIERKKSPERWIKSVFIELQKVFESFDGTMLISMVLGMVENKTGLLYFINAEHPFTILYRDKKAEFIEKELTFRKIGTQGMHHTIYITTFCLKPGDVIYAGSDGRDDIMFGMNQETQSRIINEDETLILKHIEHTDGKLKNLVETLQNSGELTDDLSLIRIEYIEYDPKIKEVHLKKNSFDIPNDWKDMPISQAIQMLEKQDTESNPFIYKIIQKLYIQEKSWQKAYKAGQRFIDSFPNDSETIYYTSLAAKMIRKLEEAIDLGERVYLRNPVNLRNLLNLTDAYRSIKKHSLALKKLEKAEKISPKDPNVLKLKKILQKQPNEDSQIP